MKNCLSFYLFFLALLLPEVLSAQVAQPDTSFLRAAVADALQSYQEVTGRQSAFNGTEYFHPAKPYLKGHQYFAEKEMANGAVRYEGTWFYGVPLLYDVIIDQVLTVHPESNYSQILVKQKVDSFLLRGHTFVHLQVDSTSASPMRSGYYDVLYSGGTKALVRREKSVQERVSKDGLEGRYDVEDKFYIWKDNTYHRVKSKRSVLKVLGDERQEVQKFLRTNKLKFRKRREEAILKATQYYDTLKQ